MTHGTSAGESRRSRRRALNWGIITIAGGLLIAIARVNANNDGADHWSVDGDTYDRTDAEIATHLLQSVNGANEVLCGAVERAFQTGSWGNSFGFNEPADANAAETVRWIGRRRLDANVLDIARRALVSADNCTRRVAARLAGHVEVARLDRALSEELASANGAVRHAAIIALGYAEQEASVPLLLQLVRDADERIRVTAIWALGAIESDAALEPITALLQRDSDPEVRRAAAWALGRIADR